VENNPELAAWAEELMLRRVIPMSNDDYREIGDFKRNFWLSYLTEEKIRENEEYEKALRKMRARRRR